MTDKMKNTLFVILFGISSGKSSTKKQFLKAPVFHCTILSIIHSVITTISVTLAVTLIYSHNHHIYVSNPCNVSCLKVKKLLCREVIT